MLTLYETLGCRTALRLSELHEEPLKPVRYVGEPGNKCFTLTFTGQRLRCRYNTEIVGPSIFSRQTLESISYVWPLSLMQLSVTILLALHLDTGTQWRGISGM